MIVVNYVFSGFHALLELPFNMFKYRDRRTIIADILKAITKSKRGVRKTQIIQSANLNCSLLNKYLDLLFQNGFILVDGRVYKLTQRGMEFLENIEIETMKMQWRR